MLQCLRSFPQICGKFGKRKLHHSSVLDSVAFYQTYNVEGTVNFIKVAVDSCWVMFDAYDFSYM